MLVTVIGTQCVGKSTFINDFLLEYPTFKTPDIDYRKIITKYDLKLNREGDYRSQKILIDFMLKQTIECAEDIKNNYILDRSIIDCLAYSIWLYYNTDTGFNYEKIAKFCDIILKNSHLYDAIVYIPLEGNSHVKIVDDNFRDTNESYRKDIDHNFKEIVQMLQTPNISLNIIKIIGTREDRINQIKNLKLFS